MKLYEFKNTFIGHFGLPVGKYQICGKNMFDVVKKWNDTYSSSVKLRPNTKLFNIISENYTNVFDGVRFRKFSDKEIMFDMNVSKNRH